MCRSDPHTPVASTRTIASSRSSSSGSGRSSSRTSPGAWNVTARMARDAIASPPERGRRLPPVAYFKDADEVYRYIGKLFEQLAEDEELAPKFRKANTIVQYQYRDPESQITGSLMEAGSALDPTPLRGFKDFYQYAGSTRVISGRDLLSSTGFEFQKEGARRVFIVTDGVIRGTGLVERVEAGVIDGGLEVAGVFDDVPQDSSTEVCDACAAAAKGAGADSFLAVGGGSVMDTAKVADAIFTHGGESREQEGFFLMPREDDGAGPPPP